MRDHELELIAALVEGRLEDETEARALIESSEEVRAEYEAQKAALEALGTLSSAAMTESERSALHRDTWTALRAGRAPNRAKTPWYYRWTPVAAGLLVVVGLVGVLSQGSNDGAETFRDMAANLSADGEGVTTTAGASADTFTDAGSQGEAAGGSDAIAPAAPADAETIDFYRATAEKIRESDFRSSSLQAFQAGPQDEEADSCLAQADLEGFRIVATGAEEDRPAEAPEEAYPFFAAIPADEDLETAPIAFVNSDTCEILHVEQ